MERINSKMDSNMTSNVKDIICGAFKFESTYEARVKYILSKLNSMYAKYNWTISVFDCGYSCASHSDNMYFFCIMDHLCVSISGTR